MKCLFAAGCFWGVEETFRKIKGVTSTTVGYTGGNVPSPSYEMVCSGKTGHAEAILIEYDPQNIDYQELLKTFWSIHNPTTPNQQGPDVGSQYRSAIFILTPEQQQQAEKSLEEQQKNYSDPIVTEIVSATPFYPAEEYHQKYLQKKRKMT